MSCGLEVTSAATRSLQSQWTKNTSSQISKTWKPSQKGFNLKILFHGLHPSQETVIQSTKALYHIMSRTA